MITKKQLMAEYKMLNIARQGFLTSDGVLEGKMDEYLCITERMWTIADHIMDLEEQERIDG